MNKLKLLVSLVLLIMFISCRSNSENPELTNHDAVWLGYKKILPYDPLDTIPYKNCCIKFDADSLYYYVDNKLTETYKMIKEDSHSYKIVCVYDGTVYENKLFIATNNKEAILKRANFDGVEEYFQLRKVATNNN